MEDLGLAVNIALLMAPVLELLDKVMVAALAATQEALGTLVAVAEVLAVLVTLWVVSNMEEEVVMVEVHRSQEALLIMLVVEEVGAGVDIALDIWELPVAQVPYHKQI